MRGTPAGVRHRATLVPLLAEAMKRRIRADWLPALESAGVPCGPINDLAEVFADPQVQSRGMAVEVPHPLAGLVSLVASPLRLSDEYRRAPPLLGEHTDEVLAQSWASSGVASRHYESKGRSERMLSACRLPRTALACNFRRPAESGHEAPHMVAFLRTPIQGWCTAFMPRPQTRATSLATPVGRLGGVGAAAILEEGWAPGARVIAGAWAFHLDDVRSRVGQHLCAPRAGQYARQIQHPRAGQALRSTAGSVRGGHGAIVAPT